MNRFFQPAPPNHDAANSFGSGRYYARLSQVEVMNEEGEVRWQFDGFDADWFDEDANPNTIRATQSFLETAELYIIEVAFRQPHANFMPLGQIDEFGEAREDSDWVEIVTQEGPPVATDEWPLAAIYSSTEAAGVVRRIYQITECQVKTKRLLDLTGDIGAQEADAADIQQALAWFNASLLDFVSVYDVGQGNAIGLCGDGGGVKAYFDLGKGMYGNSTSYPAGLRNFCFCKSPVIILSHWDADHWGAAAGHPSALAATWIVPGQLLPPTHAAFASSILGARGKILVMGKSLSSVQCGQLRLERCTGSGRNHSGLALVISETLRGTGKQMLLPGDARYPVIPSFGTGPMYPTYFSAVVPHHGADMRNPAAPTCRGSPSSRLVYSYGVPNLYHHPKMTTRLDHQATGWTDPMVTPGAAPDVRETPDRTTSLSGLGHVLLKWIIPAARPSISCRGTSCDLGPEQL